MDCFQSAALFIKKMQKKFIKLTKKSQRKLFTQQGLLTINKYLNMLTKPTQLCIYCEKVLMFAMKLQ